MSWEDPGECGEVADAVMPTIPEPELAKIVSFDTAAAYVRTQMPDETHVVIDNTAEVLWERIKAWRSAQQAAPKAKRICEATIDLQKPVRFETRGKGFGRREVAVYCCPVCKQETVLRKNWRGPIPPGAIRCPQLVDA